MPLLSSFIAEFMIHLVNSNKNPFANLTGFCKFYFRATPYHEENDAGRHFFIR